MSAPTNHWKLGLFVVTGIGTLLAVVVFLGSRSLQKETVTYWTYFDESVQGLDVGSPVKFRGVTIGDVSEIGIAPDRRHVSVACELIVTQLKSLKLVDTGAATRPLLGRSSISVSVPPDLRAQLGSAGITGVRYVAVDFFDVKDNPPPTLPFPVPRNYVPAAPSTIKNFEEAIMKALDGFPAIGNQLLALMSTTNRLVGSIDEEKLPQQASATLTHASEVMATLTATLRQADVGELSGEAKKTVMTLRAATAHLDAILGRVDGDKGLLTSVQRATDSIGNVAGAASGLGPELADTLRDVRESVESLQRLTDALETDSDMLVKGRAKARHSDAP